MKRRIVIVLAVAPILLVFAGGGVAHAVPSTLGSCAGDLTGGTFTLSGPCDSTAEIVVPNTITTVNGAGNTITAHDTAPGSFIGGVLTSTPGATMNVENLKIMGTGFTQTQPPGSCGRAALYGIFFNGAGGSVTNVTVTGITEGSNCQVGRAIVGTGTAGQTLTIADTTVSDYNKDAMHANGMTMNISDSTIGSPASLKGVTGQNGLVYQDGATGTTSGSTISGSGYGSDANANVAVLLFGAKNVTLKADTITGAGTDIGVDVAADSTGVIIDGNQIGRTAPDVADNFGFGVEVDSPGSTATLICNTFSGWNTNITGTTQAPCITTTSLPSGTVGSAYTTPLAATITAPPGTWTVSGGALPPGLALSADGTITGTPTTTGTFQFTAKVTDASGASVTRDFTITIAAAPPVTTAGTPTTAPPSVVSPEGLPRTGSPTGALTLLGTVILAVGALLLTLGTRRRRVLTDTP